MSHYPALSASTQHEGERRHPNVQSILCLPARGGVLRIIHIRPTCIHTRSGTHQGHIIVAAAERLHQRVNSAALNDIPSHSNVKRTQWAVFFADGIKTERRLSGMFARTIARVDDRNSARRSVLDDSGGAVSCRL